MERPLAIILTDIHIGDDLGVVKQAPAFGYEAKGTVWVRREFLAWIEKVRNGLEGDPKSPIEYLILAGDVWDTAIRPISEIARLSQAFFAAVKLEEVFRQILFIPGNHDHHLWTMLETQNCVVRPLDKVAGIGQVGSEEVEDFPQVLSGRLSVSGPHPGLEIPGIQPPYTGKVFLTGLTAGKLPVNVVYPNLYVLDPETQSAVVITHGHFFEVPWRLLSDLLQKALAREIPAMSLFYLQLLNAPLTEFMNHSLAQVGPLSAFVGRVYDQIRNGTTPPELKTTFDSLGALLDRELSFEDEPWLLEKIKEYGSDQLIALTLRLLQKYVQTAIRGASGDKPYPSGRYTIGFLNDPENLARIDGYLELVRRDIPNFTVTSLAFGHTHESIPGRSEILKTSGPVKIWNSGSMVCPPGPSDFLPLEITSQGRLQAFQP